MGVTMPGKLSNVNKEVITEEPWWTYWDLGSVPENLFRLNDWVDWFCSSYFCVI